MIDRQGNKIIIECDMCDETVEGGEKEEFAPVWAEAKQGGWTVRKVANEWLHGCPKCGPAK
jgi:hypothetical protein